MRIISHRGNLCGPHSVDENNPECIESALNCGFDVEIDAWIIDNEIYLGNDSPQYLATRYFSDGIWNRYNLVSQNSYPCLWIHCKNFGAIENTFNYFKGHRFTHKNDDFTLTSSGYIWTFPRNLQIGSKSIAVLPELVSGWDIKSAYAICTDYPKEFIK